MLVVVCYFFVDRPVARFVHDHRFVPAVLLRWPPRLAEWVGYLVALGISAVAVWWLRRPRERLQTLPLAIAANLTATEGIKNLLKWAFGRPPPGGYAGSYVSPIGNGAYGFHPFDFSGSYRSFPSGHAAATLAVISILWFSRPRWRWLYVAMGGLVCVLLVGLNFHFVGDVVAGAMLGSVTGALATRLCRLQPRRGPRHD